jgi:prepilin-type N-terminal cleavage/methylation domain-containing protein
MSEDGYTLVEMLAALAIIGLAFGGLVESGRVIGQLQVSALGAVHDLAERGAASRALRNLLSDAGPFLSDGVGGLDGQASGFSFDCGEAARCGARLETGRAGSWLVTFENAQPLARARIPDGETFRYGDETGDASAWPSSGTKVVALRSIVITDDSDPAKALASVKLVTDEPAGCIFDVVSQACRHSP